MQRHIRTRHGFRHLIRIRIFIVMPKEGIMIKITGYVILGVLLQGCAAMLVPETNDPREKLGWATELFNNQERPLPAERLIREAIEICKASNDDSCLGKANVTYGFFFRSNSIKKWEKFYRENGFMDKEANIDSRLEISKQYFEKGIEYYLKTEEYDALTNAYLNLGFAYYFLGANKEECGPYEKSLESYKKNITRNPEANVALPEGASSFPEYVAAQQKRAGCI